MSANVRDENRLVVLLDEDWWGGGLWVLLLDLLLGLLLESVLLLGVVEGCCVVAVWGRETGLIGFLWGEL